MAGPSGGRPSPFPRNRTAAATRRPEVSPHKLHGAPVERTLPTGERTSKWGTTWEHRERARHERHLAGIRLVAGVRR